jgi:hypothetical protein
MAVSLYALSAGCALPLSKIPGIHFCYRLSPPTVSVQSVTGMIRPLENSYDILDRTRDLPICSMVLQPATLYYNQSYK